MVGLRTTEMDVEIARKMVCGCDGVCVTRRERHEVKHET
jgi:hypothetical protein